MSTINRGIYSAASGMLAQQYVQDTIAANLANINTAGYKQDVATFREMSEMALRRYAGDASSGTPVGSVGLGVAVDRTATDMASGSIVTTGNPLDLALDGRGFFAVKTASGERYTRSGQFHLTQTGKTTDGKPIATITDDAGDVLLGAKGPFAITNPRGVTVASDGTVTSGGAAVARIKTVDAAAGVMVKQGDSLFAAQGPVTASKASVRSGCFEQSNVNAIQSMVRMITIQRAYDAAQKAVQAEDDELGKAVGDLPKT